MTHRLVAILSLLAVFAGCAPADEIPSGGSTAVPIDAAIAAFERMVPPATYSRAYANCLLIDGHDPPSSVLAALLVGGREVVPASECAYAINAPGGVHRETGKRAQLHELREFKKYGAVAAELNGSSYVHGLSGSSMRFDLEYRNGQWRVAFVKPTGVS
jgi:hypothetical protein